MAWTDEMLETFQKQVDDIMTNKGTSRIEAAKLLMVTHFSQLFYQDFKYREAEMELAWVIAHQKLTAIPFELE